jgi:chemotaxis family two-component system response regulator Rcp1
MKEIMKAAEGKGPTIEVLLVEDSPGDIRLMQEVFRTVNQLIHLQVASDGMEAMAILRQWGEYANCPRPDLILLDLNLPKMDGREVLALIKEDESLTTLPSVVLTMSDLEADIENSYLHKANCYLRKPVDLVAFENLVKSINDFWLTKVKLPRKVQAA